MGQHSGPPEGARVGASASVLEPVCLRVEPSVSVRVRSPSQPHPDAVDTFNNGITGDGSQPSPVCSGSRVAVGMVLFIIVATCVADVATSRYCFKVVEWAAEWLQSAGPIALVVFAALYAVVVVSFLPSVVLTVTGGYIFSQAYGTFGIVLSALASLAGGSVGAVIALLLGRYVLQGVAERLVARFKILNALDDVLAEHGFEVVVLLRMSPIVPYNVFNYLMGATRVKVRPFFFGSVGMVPGTVLWTVFGSMIHSIKQAATGEYAATPMHWVFLTFGLIATVVCVALTARLTSQKLSQMAAAKHDDAEPASAQQLEAGTAGAKATHKAAHKVGNIDTSVAATGAGVGKPAFLPTTTPRLRGNRADYAVVYV